MTHHKAGLRRLKLGDLSGKAPVIAYSGQRYCAALIIIAGCLSELCNDSQKVNLSESFGLWRRVVVIAAAPVRKHLTVNRLFEIIAGVIALGLEGGSVLLVAYGASEAMYRSILVMVQRRTLLGERKDVWLGFGVWLLLGLEFQLAADVVRTAVSPTWQDLGQLAAIAGIRTFLNFFLQRDLQDREVRRGQP